MHGCLYVKGDGTMSKRSIKDIIDNRNELKKLIDNMNSVEYV